MISATIRVFAGTAAFFTINLGIRLMLYQFLRDMLDVLRLRYKAPDDNRYTTPVI